MSSWILVGGGSLPLSHSGNSLIVDGFLKRGGVIKIHSTIPSVPKKTKNKKKPSTSHRPKSKFEIAILKGMGGMHVLVFKNVKHQIIFFKVVIGSNVYNALLKKIKQIQKKKRHNRRKSFDRKMNPNKQ